VRLTGELDMAGVDHFERLLAADQAPETGTFVLDLRELSFIDSSGLRAVIMADQRVRSEGGRFIVVRGAQHIELVDEPPAA
jgi:anti-anti-sigma factor